MSPMFRAVALSLILSGLPALAQDPAPPPPPPPPPGETGGPAGPAALSLEKIAEGDRLMQDRRYREAAFAYLDAVHADETSVEASFKLANVYAVLGYFDHAIYFWSNAARRSQDPAVERSAQDNIAKARGRSGQSGGGTPQLQGKAPGSGPISDAARERARAAYEQGVKQINARDYAAAFDSLSTAIRLEPTLSVAYIARGSALIGLKRYGEAVLDYQYAQKLAPGTASPLYGLAEASRALGRTPEARAYYQQYLDSPASDVRPQLREDAQKKLQKL